MKALEEFANGSKSTNTTSNFLSYAITFDYEKYLNSSYQGMLSSFNNTFHLNYTKEFKDMKKTLYNLDEKYQMYLNVLADYEKRINQLESDYKIEKLKQVGSKKIDGDS